MLDRGHLGLVGLIGVAVLGARLGCTPRGHGRDCEIHDRLHRWLPLSAYPEAAKYARVDSLLATARAIYSPFARPNRGLEPRRATTRPHEMSLLWLRGNPGDRHPGEPRGEHHAPAPQVHGL